MVFFVVLSIWEVVASILKPFFLRYANEKRVDDKNVSNGHALYNLKSKSDLHTLSFFYEIYIRIHNNAKLKLPDIIQGRNELLVKICVC